jgi:hypothetical protein
VIDQSKKTIVVRAAKLCRTNIIQYLFAEVDKKLLNGSVVKDFLSKHKLTLKAEKVDQLEKKNNLPIKNKPGRRSVSSEKIVRYIKHLTDWFLLDPLKFHTVGQTILVIWCELAVAYFGRRACSLNDILSLQEKDLRLSPNKSFGYAYHIILKNRSVPISKSLCDMYLCTPDQRADNPQIFSINRSTIENHLKTASLELGYDPELFPITPETFLERPIECGLDIE